MGFRVRVRVRVGNRVGVRVVRVRIRDIALVARLETDNRQKESQTRLDIQIDRHTHRQK